ncbi:MAG TPA: hypothetical protein VMX15_04020 [Candidatus Heimdallarchaeota archaeon]|nr:hypothetical protein [Candidatus Heimdallarchaeota archaeon]
MRRKGAIVLPVGVSVAAVAIAAVADVARYAIADTEDLLSFPQVASADQGQREEPLFAVLLPGTDRVLIMRPITQSEYGSFQLQAISYQIIEQEMLAAAIVMPVVTPTDVATFSSDLVTFLQQQVNAISGFDAFNVMPPDDH